MAPKTRQQLEHALFLREQGYEIPEALVSLIQEAEWKRQGVVEVWNCACNQPYESQVKIRGASCKKGHAMKRVFPS